jgi:hypothetical protein
MDAVKALDLIEQLEAKVAGMYESLQKEFSGDRALSELFGGLGEEERSLARMAGVHKGMVSSRPADFGEVDLEFSDFKQAMDCVSVVMTLPRDKVNEILIQCYLIESSMVELYVVAALRCSNPDIRQLLTTLGQGFRDHLTALAARVQELGIDVRNIETMRQHPRVSFAGMVTIGDRIHGKSVDISESGMFVLTAHTIPEGSEVTVSFPILTGVVTTSAMVRYSVPHAGMGLIFKMLPVQGRELIQGYVDRVLAGHQAGLQGPVERSGETAGSA